MTSVANLFDRSQLDSFLDEFDMARPEDPDAAAAFCDQLRTWLEETGSEPPSLAHLTIEADLRFIEGMQYHLRGELREAIENLQHSIDLTQRIGYERRRILSLRAAAVSYENAGMQAESTQCISEALDLAGELDDDRVAALVSHTLTMLYQAQQAWEPMLQSTMRTCEIAERVGDPHLVSRAYSGVGTALGYVARAEEGLTWLDSAEALIEHTARPLERLYLKLNRWFLLKRLRRVEECAELADELALAVDRIPSADAARLAVMLAEIRLQVGDTDGARAMLARAQTAAGTKLMTAHLIDYYRVAAELAETEGNAAEALTMLRRHVVLDRDLRGRSAELRLVALERRFERELAAKTDEIQQLRTIDQKRTVDLVQKNSELTDLVRERDEILRVVAHDLRSPLAATLMLGDSLLLDLGEQLNADAVDRLTSMRSAATEMGETIDNLLVSHDSIVTGGLSPTSTAVRQAITDVRPRAARHGVTIEDNVAEVSLDVDSPLLRRSIDDLLWNAIGSASPGAVITISVGPADHGARITMSGEGLNFEQRSRNDRSLYIARRLVERMRGSLSLEATGDTGSAIIDLRN